jgi:hypothetical protein
MLYHSFHYYSAAGLSLPKNVARPITNHFYWYSFGDEKIK